MKTGKNIIPEPLVYFQYLFIVKIKILYSNLLIHLNYLVSDKAGVALKV